MNPFIFIFTFIICSLFNITYAQDTSWVSNKAALSGDISNKGKIKPASKVSPWSLAAEIGFVMTSGNTKTQTINSKFNATLDQINWRNNIHLEALKTSNSNITSAEKYLFSTKHDWKMQRQNYLFSLLIYEDDRFSGFDFQTTASLGYGHHLNMTRFTGLSTEIGLGFRKNKLANGESQNEGIISLAADYLWKISNTSDFKEALNTHLGEEIIVTKSITSVTAKIKNDLAMKLTYSIKHTNKVPVNTDKMDTETAITLVYTF